MREAPNLNMQPPNVETLHCMHVLCLTLFCVHGYDKLIVSHSVLRSPGSFNRVEFQIHFLKLYSDIKEPPMVQCLAYLYCTI